MCERLGFPWRGSGLRRGVCATGGGCSGWSTDTSSAGLVCGAGCCCCAGIGFSSTGADAGAGAGAGAGTGAGAGDAACGSMEAFPLFFRGAGATDGSFGSAVLRGLLDFFSSFGSLGLGLGPGFLRTAPD